MTGFQAQEQVAEGFKCKGHGMYADPEHCENFYTCLNPLKPQLHTCPDHMMFSETKNSCQQYHFVRCGDRPRPARRKFLIYYGPSIHTLVSFKLTQYIIRITLAEGFQCHGHGIYADPEHCQNFYNCSDPFSPVLNECPSFQLYNEAKKSCGMYHSVDCGSRPKPHG